MVVAGEVDASNLQIATVNIALVKRYRTIGCYLLVGAATLAVISAFHHHVAVGEVHRAVFGIVGDEPDTCGGFHQRLVAVGIEGGSEITHCGVLIQLIGGIACCYIAFRCRFTVADVVVAFL